MAMVGSLLLPWVEGLIGKVADALVQRVTSMWGADGDRRKLERQLVYVRSLLADAGEKAEAKTEAGRAVKAWMKKLRAAAYEADDVLDDFQYEARSGRRVHITKGNLFLAKWICVPSQGEQGPQEFAQQD
ncbi:unnamed protein product [Urochloa humidicola]